ncbi:MAG TPA: hypothetical protein VFB96_03850 [Pirellulaceae bacterium]|nr:hypothetical protein [Pirellulaceae bacterium]
MPRHIVTLLFTLLPAVASAQVTALAPAGPPMAGNPEFQPRIVKLSLSPAAEPMPALKYELLPPLSQRTPGNAAPYYYRAVLRIGERQQELDKQYLENEEAWTTGPLDQLDKEQVGKWVQSHRLALENLKTAVNREYCDWDWRVQDLRGQETIGFVLEEVQQTRGLARVLQVKARLEIAEGRLNDALDTIGQGYQLGRDVSQPPLLVNALVGVAISSMMNERLVELIDQPGAPNVYWALIGLPRPLVDFRPALRSEMELPEKLFPFLKDAESAERTPEEWQKLLVTGFRDMDLLQEKPSSGSAWLDRLAITAMMAKNYPTAKEELIKAGMDADRVEKMPVGQVLAIQSSRVIRYSYHEIFKCLLLDYPDSAQRLRETTERLKRDGYLRPGLGQKDPLGLTGLLLPAVSNVNQASIRLARNLAAMQALEAIRMHLAANGGKLPQSLEEITIVPVPNNPSTGEPFPYELRGAEATLIAPAVLAAQNEGRIGSENQRDAIHYVITAEAGK